MSTKYNIFLTGVTGYIGGSVLNRLISHADAQSFRLKALVRSPQKAALLQSFGVQAVVGSNSDLDKLENLAAEADCVFAMADCDDLPAAEAILRGLKKRKEKTGVAPILIHTSGTGVIASDDGGLFATEKIYSDANVEQIESLPATQMHRPVDLAIVAADESGYVRTHIILPSTIYGTASNPLVERSIQNPHSIQLPGLIRASIDRGQAGMVGLGKNIWPNVHIDEVTDLFIVLFGKARSDTHTSHGREGFYFAENGEHTLYDVGKAVGAALVTLGKAQSAEPSTFTDDEVKGYFGVHLANYSDLLG